MPIQGVDDVFWILAAGQPGTQDHRVLDDHLVLAGKVLHPPAQRVAPGIRRLVQSDGALAGLGTDLADQAPRQQSVQLAAHVTDRRRPVEVADGQFGTRLDLTGGELLVVGRQHSQDKVGGDRQAAAGAERAHDRAAKYGRVTSALTAWNCTCTGIPTARSSGATPTMLVNI